MKVTYVIVVGLVAYIFGAFSKLKWETMPNKYIPLQNVIIGFLSAFCCVLFKIESNFGTALVLCLLATMGAGGIADLTKLIKKN